MFHSEFKGSHYEAGYAYGLQLKEQGVFLKAMLRTPVDEEKRQFSEACQRICEDYYPEILQEMSGICDGQEMDSSLLMDVMFCMYAYTTQVRCTCIAFQREGQLIFGRNSDFLCALEDTYESNYYDLDQGFSFIGNTTSFVQMEDGINEFGLAIGLTFVYPMVRKPGLHAGILVRYIVEKCRTVEEALQALRRLPISSSQTLTIADAQGKMVVVECNCEHMEVIEPERGSHFVAATNLFRHPQMIKYRCDLEDTIFSEVRYQTAVKALQKEGKYSLSYGMDILAGKVGFMCQYDRSQGLDTVWSSVYDITNRKVYRAEGNPARINYIEDKRCTFQ